MKSTSPVRLGIIGCGRVCRERHLPALRQVRGIEVTAICDSDPVRLNHVSGLCAAGSRFADYRDLISHQGLDAVAVLTPTSAHAEIGTAALNAGKHLFMEKPLALTLEECDALIDAHHHSDRTALLCFNLRWHRLVRRARSIIQSGALGRVKAIRSVYTHDRSGANAPDWHRKLALGGGVSFNEAVHHFDLWRYLLGLEVTEVFSQGVPSDAYEDETNTVAARLDGGVLATGVFSFLSGPNSELEIFGSQGRLHLALYRFDGLEFFSFRTFPGDLADRAGKALRSILAAPGFFGDLRRGGSIQATFTSIWSHFAECVRGTAQPECTLDEGRHALATALAAVQSASSGLPVQFTRPVRSPA